MRRHLTAIVEREGNGYVALCPEVDVASQGDSVAEARENLQEAITLFFANGDRRGNRKTLAQRSLCDPGRGRGRVGCVFFPVAMSAGFLLLTASSRSDNEAAMP